jgi:hypothetical protein
VFVPVLVPAGVKDPVETVNLRKESRIGLPSEGRSTYHTFTSPILVPADNVLTGLFSSHHLIPYSILLMRRR